MLTETKKRGGFYFHPTTNKPYVSVTTVLKDVIAKPQLQYWYGQQVYLAMVKDPSINERTALNAPYQTAENAAERGSTIHSLAEAYKTTGNQIENVPVQYKGYANALYKWIADFKPKFLENEKKVFNDQYGYAGTLDALIELNGEKYVVDFKTSKDGHIYTEAHLQVSAYIKCEPDVKGGIIIGFAEDGTYNHTICKPGFDAFIHALELYKFLNQEKLMKVGYNFI